MQFPTFILALTTLTATLGKPLDLSRRDSVAPPITNPAAGTVWKTGETQMVTWDVAAMHGARPSNPLGRLILGTVSSDGEEDLMFVRSLIVNMSESPLLSGFLILAGKVSLTLPSLPSGDNYVLCVFGSTLDVSHPFTIVGPDA
ncbi:hypothetical protein C8Q79DRAFT_924861 [Trametes meyenii]|nr:hypothetical protein C8Q79DRAFT_924861 [Trametes meyenii]